MVSAETNRKWRFVLLLLVHMVLCAAMNNIESQILKCISQRRNRDIIYFLTNSNSTGSTYSLISVTCDKFKNTYLITEDQCVKEKELFYGKVM